MVLCWLDFLRFGLIGHPGALALKMERLFENQWLFSGHASQLELSGAFITGRLGSVPVVSVQEKDCEIRTFVNRCPHRSAQVCQRRSGNTPLLECLYHGWTVDLERKLSWIPFREEYAGLACERLPSLGQVAETEVCRGLFLPACASQRAACLRS